MAARIYPKRPPRVYLAEWRDHRGLTQAQLGDRLGVSSVAISRWEGGSRRPDLNVLAAISEALGVDLSALYRHPNQPSADELLKGQPQEVWDQAMSIIKTIRRN